MNVKKPKTKQIRTTIMLPVVMDRNLELCAVRSGLSKGTVVRQAVEQFLFNQGLRPYDRPRIDVSYPDVPKVVAGKRLDVAGGKEMGRE